MAKLSQFFSNKEIEKVDSKIKIYSQQGTEYNIMKNNLYQRRDLLTSLNQDIDKVKSNLFFNVLNVIKASAGYDANKLIFSPTDPRYDNVGNNLDDMYEYDYYRNGRDSLFLDILEQIAYYGAAYEVHYERNPEKKVMNRELLDTRSVYPDPNGRGSVENFNHI
jgi:hypothetical protein